MQYLYSYEAAALWNMTERRITALCRQGRIVGAVKQGKNWMIPADAEMPLDGRTKAFSEQQREAELRHSSVNYTETGAGRHALERFEELYQRAPDFVEYTPYCLCLLGDQATANQGRSVGFALDKGIHMAYGPKLNGIIELASLQFPKRAQWHVADVFPDKQNDWADHLRGATIALYKRYPLRIGLCAIIDGELPIGGLYSSAPLIILFLSALAKLNRISLSDQELISLAHEAEKDYVGIDSGLFDVCCGLFSRRNSLLSFNAKDNQIELYPKSTHMSSFSVGLFFTGQDQSMLSSIFNQRVEECRAAAYCLKSLMGTEQNSFSNTNLREVPYEQYLKYCNQLPAAFRKRAEHWYGEMKHAEAGAEAWQTGDLAALGRLVTQSGESTAANWETGSPELLKLFHILKETSGVLGVRFYGSGFKNCCLALISSGLEEDVGCSVQQRFSEEYPKLSERFSFHICDMADGAILNQIKKQ